MRERDSGWLIVLLRVVGAVLTAYTASEIGARALAAPTDMSTEWVHDPRQNGGHFNRPWSGRFLPSGMLATAVHRDSVSMYTYSDTFVDIALMRTPLRFDMECPSWPAWAGGPLFEDHALWFWYARTPQQCPASMCGSQIMRYGKWDFWPHHHRLDDFGPLTHDFGALFGVCVNTPANPIIWSNREDVITTERTTVQVWRERNTLAWIGEDGRWRRWSPDMSDLPENVVRLNGIGEVACDLFHCVLTFDHAMIRDPATGHYYGHPNRINPAMPNVYHSAGVVVNLHLHDCNDWELWLRADIDGDGQVTIADYFSYLNMFFSGHPDARMTPPEGPPGVDDFFVFLTAFFQELG